MVLLGIIVLILPISSALTKPYTLKCTLVEEYPPVDLVINLDDRAMKLGIMVLNCFNGDYKRAWIGMFCKTGPPNCGGTVLRATTQSGKCLRPMF
jgi:hypothetical protein